MIPLHLSHSSTSRIEANDDLPNGLEMSRPASAQIVSDIRFAAAGRVGSIELLGISEVVQETVKEGEIVVAPSVCLGMWDYFDHIFRGVALRHVKELDVEWGTERVARAIGHGADELDPAHPRLACGEDNISEFGGNGEAAVVDASDLPCAYPTPINREGLDNRLVVDGGIKRAILPRLLEATKCKL